MAAAGGHVEAARTLLELGADVHATTVHFDTTPARTRRS